VVAVGEPALQVPPTGVEARSLMTTDAGVPAVSVLLIKSLRTESELSPFGVTRQAQHEIISSDVLVWRSRE
jgi:hypothetical protein